MQDAAQPDMNSAWNLNRHIRPADTALIFQVAKAMTASRNNLSALTTN